MQPRTELGALELQFVTTMLETWAQWSAKLEADGLGYPERVNFYTQPSRYPGDSAGVPAVIITDDMALGIEHCVRILPEPLRRVVVQEWLHGGALTSKARRCHCDPKTFRRRLNLAYVLLYEPLRDRAHGKGTHKRPVGVL
ncbi:MAG: hypothetical protein U5P41_07425 [Gammaproteobacteria bacterium]|nr:hypothetical protein [Gammaproteobacteria bacterium]